MDYKTCTGLFYTICKTFGIQDKHPTYFPQISNIGDPSSELLKTL